MQTLPTRIRSRPRHLTERAGALESLWTPVRGLRVHTRVSRKALAGPPVILVHGVGMSSRYMVPTAALLSEEFSVYAPDLPGFGKSDQPGRVLMLEELTEWLGAWMDDLGLPPAVFLGNSLGCQIIADLAIRHPGRVLRAVLQAPTPNPHARTWLWHLVALLKNIPREHPSQGLVGLAEYRDCGVWRAIRTFHSGLRDPIERKLRKMRCPTLVVRGGRDPIVPQRWAEEAARLLPRGRLVVIPGAPHTANYSTPLELVRVIRPFLREAGCGMA